MRSLRYEFKPGLRSSHGRVLHIAEAWSRSFRILEVGTASGYIGKALRDRGFSAVVGIEQDPHLAEQARPYYHAHYVADLERDEPLAASEEFDALICSDVLEHLREPFEQLQRLARRVRPSGQVIVSLPNIANWVVRLMLLSGRFEYQEHGLLDRGHLRFFTRRTACQLIEQAGLLRIRRMYVTPLPLGRVFEHRLPRWTIEAMERSYYGAALCWKGLFAYQFVFLAERVGGAPHP